MKDRTTQKELEELAMRINLATGGPTRPYDRDDDGKLRANPGHYHISGAYGGVALYQIENAAGGASDVFRSGHTPKRLLAQRMRAFLDGFCAAAQVFEMKLSEELKEGEA